MTDSALKLGRSQSQILSFQVGDEDYGIDIQAVREIRGWSGVRSVPGAAGFVLGILRLRGSIIPIVDLRSRLGLGRSVCDERTVIVIVAISGEASVGELGLVVDSVSDVIELAGGSLLEAPELGTPAQQSLVRQVALLKDRMFLLIELDRVFGQKELAVLERMVVPSRGPVQE